MHRAYRSGCGENFMELTDKLQNIIRSSEFLKKIQAVKSSEKNSTSKFRELSRDEITVLEKNGNSAEDWSMVTVHRDFTAEHVHGNRFRGKCRLGFYSGATLEVLDGTPLPTGIYDSVITNSCIGNESLISRCSLISNYGIGGGAVLYNTGSVTAGKGLCFGNGIVIPAGPETGEIPVPLFAEMDMEAATLILEAADDPSKHSDYITMYRSASLLEYGYIDAGCVITDTTSIRDSFIGEGAVIRGALSISGSTVLSSADEKTEIGEGVKIENSMIQQGCGIKSMSIILNSLVMEHTEAGNQCRVSSSVIGPNSALGGGEVTSTIAGPFTVSHHQSLLIAAIWPGGRGNIGYGANVGSNHTSRLPDQEIYPAEGMFFGLGCSVKFPADYRRSPYSIISTGTVTQPQRVEFPFSLINSPSHAAETIPLFLNEIIPAWTLRENIYSVIRNESKYRTRNRAKRNSFDFTVLRPGIIDMMISAREKLKDIAVKKEFYTEEDIPGAGKNYITEESRLLGIETYTFYIKHYVLSSLFDTAAGILKETGSVDINLIMHSNGRGYWDHAMGVYQSEALHGNNLSKNLEALVASLEKVYTDTFESRKKDYTRGLKIIERYSRYHKSPENDLSLSEMRRDADDRIAKVKEVITVIR